MCEHHGTILSGEYFRSRVHIAGEAPRDAFSFVIPITGGVDCLAQGHVFGEEDVLAFPPGSKVDIVTPGAAGELMLTIADVDAIREGCTVATSLQCDD